ncbi:MAG: hypothetical protein JWO03_1601 [Bacteroidetes bacterium]|nr:hypothetical protein [Bacteroidota bacterium]
MEAVIKRNKIQPEGQKKAGKGWLIVAVIFFILMFVPDPIKLIPVVGEGEELLEGGISFSALLIYFVKLWLHRNIKEHLERPH